MKDDYKDMIHFTHYVSKKRAQMPLSDRAAQFSPFAALNGFDAMISETKRITEEKMVLSEDEKEILDRKYQILLEKLNDPITLSVTYFVPDPLKSGGRYVTKTGNLKKIDVFGRRIVFTDETKISLYDVVDFDSELFEDTF